MIFGAVTRNNAIEIRALNPKICSVKDNTNAGLKNFLLRKKCPTAQDVLARGNDCLLRPLAFCILETLGDLL